MSAIAGKDTKPEMVVRSLVHRMGYRFRLHRSELPGKPDLVFSRLKKIILVHGCFWHRHRCHRGQSMPSTRQKFWQTKLEGNKARDIRTRRKLRCLGWDVMVVWECQTKPARLDKLADRIVGFLQR